MINIFKFFSAEYRRTHRIAKQAFIFNENNSSIAMLPDETFMHVFSFLNKKELQPLATACQRFKHLTVGEQSFFHASWPQLDYSQPLDSLALSIHDRQITGLAQLPNRDIVTSSWNGIKIHSPKDGHLIKAIKFQFKSVNALSVFPNGKICCGFLGGEIQILGGKNYVCKRKLTSRRGHVESITVLSDNIIAAAYSDNCICIWNINTGECLKNLIRHNYSVKGISLLPNGNLVSYDFQDIYIWNVKDGKCILNIPRSLYRDPICIHTNGDIYCATHHIYIIDSKTGKHKIIKGVFPNVTAIQILTNGDILIGKLDGTIQVLDAETKISKSSIKLSSAIKRFSLLDNGDIAVGLNNEIILLRFAYLQQQLIPAPSKPLQL